jgi:hypothetical protein
VLDGDASGDSAVPMLWRFLERELPKHSQKIKFTNCGPSPFHARGYLRAGTAGQGPDIEWSLAALSGYAEYEFLYDPGAFAGDAAALAALYQRLGRELSLFYRLVINRNENHKREHVLISAAEGLVARNQAEGL